MKRFYTNACRVGVIAQVPFGQRFASTNSDSNTSAKSAPKSALTTVPRFDDSRAAHGRKRLSHLLRSVAVMQAMRIPALALRSDQIVRLCETYVGSFITFSVIKMFFFNHFCGGEHTHELKYTVRALEKDGIGAIFDYAAEAEEAAGDAVVMCGMTALSKKSDLVYNLPVHRFNETMTLNLLCIGHASLMLPKTGDGFAAVKLSGLCEPMLLARVSALQLVLRQAWVSFVKEGPPPPLEECRVVIGFKLNDRFQSTELVRQGMRKRCTETPMTKEQEDAIIKLMDPEGKGQIDYLTYVHHTTNALLRPAESSDNTSSAAILQPYMRNLPSLTQAELSMWQDLEKRVAVILRVASDLKVKVMIDAEQSFYQMAIDYLVRTHQRTYNKTEPVIYNTYQCYLNYASQRLSNDLARAESEGWVWAGKMVRGAYMNQEEETALANGYSNPIWPTLEGTHKCYNGTADHILNLIANNPTRKYGVLFGTHNPDSLTKITKHMTNMPGNHQSSIAFAQLYGMADHLTVGLAKVGLPVFKYIPYGPVKETILYLGRRAKENNAVLQGARPEEYSLLMDEVRRRMMGGTRDK